MRFEILRRFDRVAPPFDGFDLADELYTENGTSIAFSYGADRQRFRQVNNFTGTTTIYVEGLFDREVKGALVNDVHYIVANGQAVATFSSSNDSATSTRYLHRDHVGSVTHVTNETGTLVDTFAYDAWGARRDPSNWQDYAGQPSPPPSLRRPQFTGHEGLHDVGIVHMNGRIYDPKLGRVLSADPFVQFAGDGQSYNRYSYALNNPLAYTDPSGFLAERVCFLSACGAAGSARVGAIGSGSSRPQIGVTKTIRFGGGWSGGFSIPFDNPGWGPGTTCPSGMLCQSGESESRASSPDLTIWMSTPGSTVTYTPYAGLIADDTGESRGGALASSTIAGYERNWRSYILPNITALGERGVPGSFADNAIGYTKAAYNTAVDFAAGQMGLVGAMIGPLVPRAQIADNQLMGAAIFEGGSWLAGAAFGGSTALRGAQRGLQAARSAANAAAVTNPVPRELARVVSGNRSVTTLGRAGDADVFVTAADDIAGLNASQLAQRLSISPAETFTVIRFPTPAGGGGIASPVFRTNSGFLQGGLTRGGARES